VDPASFPGLYWNIGRQDAIFNPVAVVCERIKAFAVIQLQSEK